MNPIQAPSVIERGIALYVPKQVNAAFATLEIYFSLENPVFSWLNCHNSQSKLWFKRDYQKENGTLFLYQLGGSDLTLPLGFYTLVLAVTYKNSSTKTGQLTVGVLEPTPRLVIGLPYSVYPSINVA